MKIWVISLFTIATHTVDVTHSEAAPLPKIFENPKAQIVRELPPDQLQNLTKKVQLELGQGFSFGKANHAAIHFGYQPGFLAFDVGLLMGALQFKDLVSTPTYTETAGATTPGMLNDPTSEFNRARGSADSWGYQCAQPGLSVTARFMPLALQKFSQTGRYGFGPCQLTDKANNLKFKGLLHSFDARINYFPTMQSKLSFSIGANYNFGWAHSDKVTTEARSSTRIPIQFFAFKTGIEFGF